MTVDAYLAELERVLSRSARRRWVSIEPSTPNLALAAGNLLAAG